jgi:uncharacterized protein YyaL (SSP411 family)
MSDSLGNRLDEEASPYLQQHADNPVNWQPWDDAALDEARERDVPIFLSVGYSACHWCHVMAEESFEDESIAEVLNERFVAIKVDREERPDLDSVYQTVCQLVTGGGGWPLSAFLTPEGKPFYVGTYFPPEPRRNMPGFGQLCEDVANSWADPEQRAEMESRADQWTAAARDRMDPSSTASDSTPGTSVLDDAASAAVRGADRDYGGFGTSGPKFPHPGRVDLLLRVGTRSDRPEPLRVAKETLDAMATGGLYDHVGAGFHRYCVDREWRIPHFEKMLYDNAELPKVYLAGHRATGDVRYALVAQETLSFVARELTHPDGGFYSTLDARSGTPASRLDDGEEPEREEGAFYTWTEAEVSEVLDDPAASLFCERYGIEPGGNFERGTTVLAERIPVGELAKNYGMDVEEARQTLTEARVRLFAARSDRPRPHRDEKVLAGWNGLMISAFAEAAMTLDPVLSNPAEEALSFVREHLWDDDAKRLARRWKDGDVAGEGYLEDYAFLGRAAFDVYQATGAVEPLAFAIMLAEVVVDAFHDDERGTLYFTANDAEELVARPQELTDQSTPSSLGVAVRLLVDLDGFTDRDFGAVAREVLQTHANRIEASPLEHVSLAMAADAVERGPLELTVAGDTVPADWTEALASRYLPDAIVARRPATEAGLEAWLDTLGLDEAPPVWADREARDGTTTVYACRSYTCSPPAHDIRTALDWAENQAEN